MKTSTVCGVAGLIVLGICSTLFTGAIIARSKAANEDVQGSDIHDNLFERLRDIEPPKQPAGQQLGLADLPDLQWCKLGNCEISETANGGGINVSSKVQIMDNADHTYCWTLSIRNASDDSEVLGINYENQTFKVPQGEATSIAFDESVPMEAGTYLIELRLWSIGPDSNLTMLRNVRESHADCRLAGVKRIEIRG